MKSDQEKLLNLKRLPVFLNVEQAADFLGLSVDEVRILVGAKLLPLAGNSDRGEKQLFVAAKLEKLVQDRPDWPDQARRQIISYHRRRNSSRKRNLVNGEASPPNGLRQRTQASGHRKRNGHSSLRLADSENPTA